MRVIFILLFVVQTFQLHSQHINGPSNIRVSPNGGKLFSINDFVSISIDKNQQKGDWYKIQLPCLVKPINLINRKIIKQNVTLYNDSVGFEYAQFQLFENILDPNDGSNAQITWNK